MTSIVVYYHIAAAHIGDVQLQHMPSRTGSQRPDELGQDNSQQTLGDIREIVNVHRLDELVQATTTKNVRQ